MRRIAKLKKQRLCALTAAIVASAWMPTAMAEPAAEALPELKKVVSGVAENAITKDEVKHEMNIELGDKAQAVINWNSFNIGRDATVNFNGSGFKVLNRVEGNDPSEIYGNLKGTGGTVFLINPNGITFGAGAHVEVGSLVASTLNISDDNFNKGTYNFVGGNTGVIKNLADITANDDGFVALLAHQVVNGKDVVVENGEINIEESLGKKSEANTITAGQVAMAAGKNIKLELQYDEKIGVRLNTSVDNNGLTVITEKPGNDYPTNDYVINASNVTAKRGYVLMKVSDVNEIGTNLVCQTGTVKASRMTQDKGAFPLRTNSRFEK